VWKDELPFVFFKMFISNSGPYPPDASNIPLLIFLVEVFNFFMPLIITKKNLSRHCQTIWKRKKKKTKQKYKIFSLRASLKEHNFADTLILALETHFGLLTFRTAK
jgi:hypothetical protein